MRLQELEETHVRPDGFDGELVRIRSELRIGRFVRMLFGGVRIELGKNVHKFSHHNAGRLEHPDRYELLKPKETLQKFGLGPGMTFIDIGADTGFFSREASAIVGKKGTVHALDMSPEMLKILEQNGVPGNVHVAQSEEYRVPLPDETGDLTLLSTVVHETPDVKRLLAEAARVTKKSGTVAIIEWKKQEEEIGPPKVERLGIDELLPHVSSFEVAKQGDLNNSHYYILIRRK